MSAPKKPARQAKPPPPPEDDSTIISSFRVPRVVVERLDAWIEEQNAGRRGPKLTRNDVIRGLMDWASEKKPDWEVRR